MYGKYNRQYLYHIDESHPEVIYASSCQRAFDIHINSCINKDAKVIVNIIRILIK